MCFAFIFLINNQDYIKKILIITLFFLISVMTIMSNEFLREE